MSINIENILQEKAVLDVLQQQFFDPITRALQEKAKAGTLPTDTLSVLNSMTNDLLIKINRSSTSPQSSDTERATPESSSTTTTVSPPVVQAVQAAPMIPRRKNKRSLEDTVQKLGEKRMEAEIQAAKRSPPVVAAPPTAANLLFPQAVLAPMARWMNPLMPQMMQPYYMNNLLHTPLGNYLTSIGGPVPNQEVKQEEEPEEDVNVDSDDLEASPSPSSGNGDIAYENIVGVNENDSEKPFACEHANCYKRFANKFLLKKHRFIHTGLRPHQCPFCSKKFNRKDNLLRHKKTHLQNGANPVVVNPGAFDIRPARSTRVKKQQQAQPQLPQLPQNQENNLMMNNLQIDNFRFQLENYLQMSRMANSALLEKNGNLTA